MCKGCDMCDVLCNTEGTVRQRFCGFWCFALSAAVLLSCCCCRARMAAAEHTQQTHNNMLLLLLLICPTIDRLSLASGSSSA